MKKYFWFILFLVIFSFTYPTDSKIIEIWQKTMKYGVSSQRAAVIKTIEDGKSSDAYNLIQDALISDPNPDIRGAAAYSLINLKINSDSLWNSSLATETNSDVLRKVVFGVSELKIKSAGPKMFDILTNRISNPRESMLSATIIRSIGSIGYKPAGDFLFSTLSNLEFSPEIRGAAAVSLGDLGDPKYIPSLKSFVENPGEVKEVRMYSAFALGKSGDKKSLTILMPIIENETEDINVRLWAIAGLGYIKDPSVTEKLITLVKVDNVRIRLEAVKALGVLKNDSSVDILTYKALYDPELAVKKEAEKALQNMGIDVKKLGNEQTNTAPANTNKMTSTK